MKLGSLFAGSGSFELSGLLCGIEPVWNAEIEPFPCRVLKQRFPDVPNLGNVQNIHGDQIQPVDIICGGWPCVGISIAGERKGLADERSGLFYDMIRIVREMRQATGGKYPRYILWENVPNIFKVNKGDDFYNVVQECIHLADPDVSVPRPSKWLKAGGVAGDGWSFAWRLISAEFYGVPQRRKRVYALLDLGGERAQEILFERPGSNGYSEACYQAWKQLASGNAPGAQVHLPSSVYDARGNGDGRTTPCITGDHNNRITDYTVVVVEQHGRGHRGNA